MPEFVHLHTHTEFSLLDGLSKPQALAERAAELGMKALAITDHGVLFGIVDFYQACQKVGIKPIIGIEAYVSRTTRQSRNKQDGKPHHLVLLAQNQTGYQNLLKLASIAQLEGFYYKPRIDREVLAKYSEGIIVLTACVAGEIPQLLHQGQVDQAREAVRWYQKHFPARFYIELQTHDIPEFDHVYPQMIALAREMDVPLVVTNDIHYARREQATAHDVLLCIQTSKTVNEPKRMKMSDDSYYMKSPREMAALYPEVPEAVANTVKIAEQCNVELQFAPPYHIPQFPLPEEWRTSEEYMRHLCYAGLQWRYGERAAEPQIVERLEYEMGIIHQMGFDDYFLIVWDLCQASKKLDIWWNVRGSGAGSVVAYTLGITHIDPLKNRLMFERFLNPARVNMPDIDLDYPDDRREELIAYTLEKYGSEQVAAIITFGTLGARAAIRDVGRAMDIPLNEVDRVARLIPNLPGKPVSIAQALRKVPDLKAIYESTAYIKKLLDTAQEVEGVSRHASTHAAGVLISDKPLVEYLPLHRPTKSNGGSAIKSISQWPMETVDALGMLKVDFLGLRTLTQMRKACQLIQQKEGLELTLFNIPYERAPDDPALDAQVKPLYDLLASGDTTGVFQVESAGMRRTLQEMQPQEFQHIVAVLALYRPGPMEQIPAYIRRLHGEEKVEYRHPILEEILSDTYGIIVYQEQIMEIAVVMAGYERGEADMLRKAVAKKKQKLMVKHKQLFHQGSLEKGIPAEAAEAVWGDIEFFARYGFNRAHATDYAVITAQTAYLKAHYPLEFMTALLTTEHHDIEKVGHLIADARRSGMEVRRPCINHSAVDFTIEVATTGNRFIRIGLGAIKNVGDAAVRPLVEARQAGGVFTSLDDFAERVDLRQLNHRALEYLIQAGALDDFGERAALLTLTEAVLGVSIHIHAAREIGQFTLFAGMERAAPQLTLPTSYPPIPNRKLLDWEKELLGIYLSEHPLERMEQQLLEGELINTTISRLLTERKGKQLSLLGMIERVHVITTKKGDPMAFVTLAGPSGSVDVVVFPRTYRRYKEQLTTDRILVVSGKLDSRSDRDTPNLLADWFKDPQALLKSAGNYHQPRNQSSELKEARSTYSTTSTASPPAAHESVYSLQQRNSPLPPPQTPATSSSIPPISQATKTPSSPPEPPAPPSTLYITFKRSADQAADFKRIAHLYQFITAAEGEDRFIFLLAGAQPVELSFPNANTRYTPALQAQIKDVSGVEEFRVVLRG
ncbi:MAG: DNA polymerase III subunit alpha [Anaerolineae bacterium]|nr:DNA polymerase III subunit alpha [Anaerolineae bacterium]